MNYPVAVIFDVPSYSNIPNNLYPYEGNYWEETAKKFHITVPFEIMDRTYGTSKCSECKQVYSGHQYKCVKKVPAYVSKSDGSSYESIEKGYRPIGDRFQRYSYGSYDTVTRHTEVDCGGWCNWTHSSQFAEQASFFNFLSWLSSAPVSDNSTFKKYKDLFPPGMVEVLEHRMLMNEVENLKMENQQIKSAIKMMAEKMNHAGQCLSFGF